MTEGSHGKNPNQFGQNRDFHSRLSEIQCSVMNFDQCLFCALKNFITDCISQSTGTGIRVSIFNRCNDATVRTLGSPTSACVIRHHYSVTYTQSLHTINGLIAVRRVGNLLCGLPSNIGTMLFISFSLHQWRI